MSFLIIVFGWLHVFFAVGWIGGALLMTLVLEQSFRTLSPSTVAEFTNRFMPRFGVVMGVFSTLTIVFGAPLFYTMTGGRFFEDAMGRADRRWNGARISCSE
ncbi:hypothetical protein B9Q02_10050 [Candidatus Marsarchaeota G1 archaeon BE_D]|jgi:hypothetical protein|uniref:Copper resistance protein D domain-containing protein n=1 Tax=Candidatus Marsarchaeota G1 archaeon BE_D TaxID=1978156 RepID=A0A2R6AC86_9ARCH|nr:MAG: hypothetical protein B9Q02_10050 [Candidatus Marsarchaeota G1 archaeon BE_D]